MSDKSTDLEIKATEKQRDNAVKILNYALQVVLYEKLKPENYQNAYYYDMVARKIKDAISDVYTSATAKVLGLPSVINSAAELESAAEAMKEIAKEMKKATEVLNAAAGILSIVQNLIKIVPMPT